MDVTLQRILLGCKKNDRSSQKALYDRYFNLFMMMSLRYINSQHEAEEVLNNAFIRIFRYINKFNGHGSFEGWTKRIVVNCCLTYINKPKYGIRSRVISLHAVYETGSFIKETGIADEEMEKKYTRQYLLELLTYLPETTRLVFNLYVFEEYNHKEIAALLGMAERTSQSHLAKARKILSTEIDKKKLINKIQRI